MAPTYSAGQGVTLPGPSPAKTGWTGDPTVDYDTRADRCVLELWAGSELRKTGAARCERGAPPTESVVAWGAQ